MKLPNALFSQSSKKKKKKNLPRKKLFLFREMELFSANIKRSQKTETPKKIPYISGSGNPKKASYTSINRTFQSTPRKYLIL